MNKNFIWLSFIIIIFTGCDRKRVNPYDPVNFVKPIWTSIFDDSSYSYVQGNFIRQTIDGGYIIISSVFHSSGGNMMLIKINAYGQKSWEKKFAGRGKCALQLPDGGYIVGADYGNCVLLMKTDVNGDKIWEKVFTEGESNFMGSLQQTTDGGYIISGEAEVSNSNEVNKFLIKTDVNGEKVWDNVSYEGSCHYYYYNEDIHNPPVVIQNSENDYIMLANCMVNDNTIIKITKINNSGSKVWEKTLDLYSETKGYSIYQASDGGYVIGGSVRSGNYHKALILKTNKFGNELWSTTFQPVEANVYGKAVCQTSDGGYIMCGSAVFSDYNADELLIKTDASGNELWDVRFRGQGYDKFNNGCLTSDNNYIATGTTANDILVMKISIAP